jgi:hypothetical protein
MSPPPLTPGELVRYPVTSARWHLAEVRRVDRYAVEVEFFWGEKDDVPLAQVERFHDFLGARRVLSLKRTDLCRAFFNKPLARLREERVRKIQATLRRHGLTFRPTSWPTPKTRIKILRDTSIILGSKQEKETKFEALLPRWLEPLRLPPSSRDPLGFQAPAERLANELLPGLTGFTSRVGYYGFLTWAVQFVNGSPCPGGQTRQDRLHRLERALVLSEFVRHGADDNSCPLLGQRSKTRVLQDAEGDRFRVPKRILKNQASAGAYRLYFTSLRSLGFALDDSDLGAEGLLPLTATALGGKLARAFQKRLGDGFAEFALGDGTLGRETVRSWGERLCFSCLGGLPSYRDPFLEGFLLGNSPEAETRYRTVRRLFQRGLLTGDYQQQAEQPPAPDAVAEEDARAAEETPAVQGLGNGRVLLRFYEEAPGTDNRDFQAAAVFELVSLGLAALFQAVVEGLRDSGRLKPAALAGRLAGEAQLNGLWTSPLPAAAARAPTARALLTGLLEAGDPIQRGALGGALLARVFADAPLKAVAEDLAANPALVLVNATLWSRPERSLAEAFPNLVAEMVGRHQTVSVNKNRQRWCYLDDGAVVKDDVKEMQVGLHALRFPQLFSLCRDLGLRPEELQHGV